ncbi:MAG: mechanosensitive ion channel family protein [Lachnospiraceae bacterium]|nr:mechanosensitive ion channel family protein [Lachnospiraceae bacterium]
MRSKTMRMKAGLYFLLAILTVVFAVFSLQFYASDLESRINPQIGRAINQVSRLLPQLEENEKALHEILSDPQTGIDESLSWMNRVINLRVGRKGHMIVVAQKDFSILAHSDARFIGEKLHLAVGNLNMEDIPNLEDQSGNVTEKMKAGQFHLFLPNSYFRQNQENEQYYTVLDAGAYGAIFSYKDTFIICGVTPWETLSFVVFRCILSTLLFFAIAWVFVCYIGFAYEWHKEEYRAFCAKLRTYAILAVAIIFLGLWYYQVMMDITGDISTMNDHADAAVETLNTYQTYRDELSDLLDRQYLEKCRTAADLVLKKGKENLTRKNMAEIAEKLGVEYVYVFDKYGKVLVTNSPYDHFQISNNKGDQSYAFRPLLDGREYVIQDVQEDDTSGEKRQYIGVSIRDGNDLCDGFVQIAVDSQLREQLLGQIGLQTVLDDLVIGIPRHALAIDKNTLQIVATTGLGYCGEKIEELGIDKEKTERNYDGVFIIDGKTYYASVSEAENVYLMPLMLSKDNSNALAISCKLTLLSLCAFAILVFAALFGYQRVEPVAEEMQRESVLKQPIKEVDGNGDKNKADDDIEEQKKAVWEKFRRAQKKYGFNYRWKKHNTIPIHKQTPEMRTVRTIFRLLLIFSVAFLLYASSLAGAGAMRGASPDGFAYVLAGNWEKGVNLFSVSYCLFLLCVMYVFQVLLNKILFRIAKMSVPRIETILLLLRSVLKYACALIFLYIGLAQFGIDTRALWASAGVLSLMVGFGAKDLIGDIIAGLFIIFEGTYKIGDWVIFENWAGIVEEIGLRYTKIGYFSETKIVNNSAIRDIIASDGEVAKEILKVPISYETNLLEIEKLFKRELPIIGAKVPYLIKPLKYRGVCDFEASYYAIRINIYSPPWARRKAYRAVLREIKILFDREHISVPYNHVVVSDYRDEINTYFDDPDDLQDE